MRQWTLQERQRQAQLIRRWKPWAHSTGATTFEGKEASKMNALKSGAYSQRTKDLYGWIRESGERGRDVFAAIEW
jgi:hypothetical protein